jgi:hypothetical protein
MPSNPDLDGRPSSPYRSGGASAEHIVVGHTLIEEPSTAAKNSRPFRRDDTGHDGLLKALTDERRPELRNVVRF